MKKLTIILSLVSLVSLLSLASLAADLVLGNGNATLTWTPGGGANLVATWPAPPPSGWTPTYAIVFNKTNNTQQLLTGLYFQNNWDVKLLMNVRSNHVGYFFANTGVRLGSTITTNYWNAYWGNSTLKTTPTICPTSTWLFCEAAFTNLAIYLSTNGITFYVDTTSCTTWATNTTSGLSIGKYSTSYGCFNLARCQLIDNAGILRMDLQAQSNGTFYDAVGKTNVAFGNQNDSLDITGQTFPAQSWK